MRGCPSGSQTGREGVQTGPRRAQRVSRQAQRVSRRIPDGIVGQKWFLVLGVTPGFALRVLAVFSEIDPVNLARLPTVCSRSVVCHLSGGFGTSAFATLLAGYRIADFFVADATGGRKTCEGIVNRGGQCTLSHDEGAIQIRGPCKKCGEKRCKTHCRCGRRGEAVGRNAPRVPKNRMTQIPPTKRSKHEDTRASPVVPAAVGHPSNLAVEVFSDASWFDALVAEMRYASTVWIATYVFDDPQVAMELMRRLRGQRSSPFACMIIVDRAYYESRKAVHQRPRLRELQEVGAKISLSDGHDGSPTFGYGARKGIMHYNAVVLDHAVAFTGGANLTMAARANRELVFRMRGPPVAPIKAAILDAERAATCSFLV